MPPRARIASLAWSRLKSTSEPVTTMLIPVSVRGVPSSRSSSIVTPAARHLSTITRCQSTPNHSTTASAMVGPTPSAAASFSRSASWIACHRAELGGQRPRGGRPDVPDRQRRPATRHSGRLLRVREVVQQPLAVGGEHRVVALALLGGAGEQRRPQQLGLVEVEHVALVLDHPGVEQRVGRLGAQALDVERSAAGHVEDPVEQLRRAAAGGWGSAGPCRPPSAAPAPCRRTGTRSASPTRLEPLGAQRQHRADDLGDHVAGLAQHHGVAGPDVLALAPRGRCAGSPARPSSRPPGSAPSPRTASPGRCGRCSPRWPAAWR